MPNSQRCRSGRCSGGSTKTGAQHTAISCPPHERLPRRRLTSGHAVRGHHDHAPPPGLRLQRRQELVHGRVAQVLADGLVVHQDLRMRMCTCAQAWARQVHA